MARQMASSSILLLVSFDKEPEKIVLGNRKVVTYTSAGVIGRFNLTKYPWMELAKHQL